MTYETGATFPAERRSAGTARRFVARQLSEWGREDLMDTAVLLVSELVTNAVLHAGGPVDLTLRLSGSRLRVEVGDRDPRPPLRVRYSEHSSTGRGLLLVDRAVDRWGVERRPAGKTVWFELSGGDDDRGGHQRTQGGFALSASS